MWQGCWLQLHGWQLGWGTAQAGLQVPCWLVGFAPWHFFCIVYKFGGGGWQLKSWWWWETKTNRLVSGIYDTTIYARSDTARDQFCKCLCCCIWHGESMWYSNRWLRDLKGMFTARGRESPNLNQWALNNLVVIECESDKVFFRNHMFKSWLTISYRFSNALFACWPSFWFYIFQTFFIWTSRTSSSSPVHTTSIASKTATHAPTFLRNPSKPLPNISNTLPKIFFLTNS